MVSNYERLRASAFGLRAYARKCAGGYRQGRRFRLVSDLAKARKPKPEAPDLLRGFLRPLCQRAQERVGGWRRRDVSVQQGLEGDHAVVEFAGAVFVLLHDGAVQADAGERAAGARVSEH